MSLFAFGERAPSVNGLTSVSEQLNRERWNCQHDKDTALKGHVLVTRR
jgi:hypothetical protein